MTGSEERPAARTLRSARFASDPVLQACVSGDETLHEGMTGPAVAKVQQALMDLGYVLRDFGPDGVFGRETTNAVDAFVADILAGSVKVEVKVGVGFGEVVSVRVGSAPIAAIDDRFADEPADPVDDDPGGGAQSPPLLPADPSPEAVVAAADYAGRAVDLALAQAAAGAHFLPGSAGARPGGKEGTQLQPGGVSLAPSRTDPVDPAVFAARCERRGLHLCAGRFGARNGGIAGGRPAASTDTDLILYLGGLAALPEAEWKPFFRFFSPRRVERGLPGARLVWGEDCRPKQHFDGVGLVNWCLEQAVDGRYPITYDIGTWATDESGTDPVALADPPRRGDIVLRAWDGRFTHIGFMVGDHDPDGLGDLGNVVLAEQASVGVVKRRFTPSGWTVRRRPTPALLHD